MARTLNWSGGNSHVLALFAGDDDNTLGFWNASGRVTPDITQARGTPTAESLTWNGHTVVGIYDGTNTTYMPAWRFNSGYPTFATTGTWFILIGNTKAGTMNTLMADNGGNNFILAATGTHIGNAYASAAADTTSAVSGGNYFGAYFTYDQSDSTKRNTWYGLAGGTIAKEASAWNFSTTPSGRLLVFIGSNASQSNFWPGDLVACGYFDSVMTQAEMQAINDDPYGAFFPAGGASVKAKSNYLSTQMSNA